MVHLILYVLSMINFTIFDSTIISWAIVGFAILNLTNGYYKPLVGHSNK
jgi:hypothetical protein